MTSVERQYLKQLIYQELVRRMRDNLFVARVFGIQTDAMAQVERMEADLHRAIGLIGKDPTTLSPQELQERKQIALEVVADIRLQVSGIQR